MREILFRGKRLDNGEWVEGYLCRKYFQENPHDRRVIQYKTKPHGNEWKPDYMTAEIYPDTVGQYTGLTDWNGQKIFEGDIVEGPCHSAWRHDTQRCVVAYGRYGFECRHHVDGLDSDYYTYKVLFSKKVEVIGNIHDNPELLEGGE